MTSRERFLSVMAYGAKDRVPNHELGVWPQTIERWESEGLDASKLHWDWFRGEEYFEMDPREYIGINLGMMPPFETEVLEKTERYEVIRHASGVVTKALIEGTVRGGRMSMDQYLRFPVENIEDFRALKKRYDPSLPERWPADWQTALLTGWRDREHVLALSRNCGIKGFYWLAREWMGTENLSCAWYMQPELMAEMMEFIADFTIAVCGPILDEIAPDYAAINEDLSMKTGPLLGPDLYKQFIFPNLKRVTEFMHGKGVKHIMLDTDGNPGPLMPLFMEAGVDGIWPLERASNVDPVLLRREYGRDLLLWGGVDKRELAKDEQAIDVHLRHLAPLIEEGGYIPTVDHTVPPDVPLANFCYYMERKKALLRGEM